MTKRSYRDTLAPYAAMFAQGDQAMKQNITNAAPRDLDINIPMPRMWHYGPPPGGWGHELAGWVGANLGAVDPDRRFVTNGVVVGIRWMQTQLNAFLSRSGGRLAIDGSLGPITMNAILLYVRDVLHQPVRSFDERNVASMWAAARMLPRGYTVEDPGADLPGRVILGTQLEASLAAIRPLAAVDTPPVTPPAEPPPPPPSSSGTGLAIAAAAGVGLGFLWMRRASSTSSPRRAGRRRR